MVLSFRRFRMVGKNESDGCLEERAFRRNGVGRRRFFRMFVDKAYESHEKRIAINLFQNVE